MNNLFDIIPIWINWLDSITPAPFFPTVMNVMWVEQEKQCCLSFSRHMVLSGVLKGVSQGHQRRSLLEEHWVFFFTGTRAARPPPEYTIQMCWNFSLASFLFHTAEHILFIRPPEERGLGSLSLSPETALVINLAELMSAPPPPPPPLPVLLPPRSCCCCSPFPQIIWSCIGGGGLGMRGVDAVWVLIGARLCAVRWKTIYHSFTGCQFARHWWVVISIYLWNSKMLCIIFLPRMPAPSQEREDAEWIFNWDWGSHTVYIFVPEIPSCWVCSWTGSLSCSRELHNMNYLCFSIQTFLSFLFSREEELSEIGQKQWNVMTIFFFFF